MKKAVLLTCVSILASVSAWSGPQKPVNLSGKTIPCSSSSTMFERYSKLNNRADLPPEMFWIDLDISMSLTIKNMTKNRFEFTANYSSKIDKNLLKSAKKSFERLNLIANNKHALFAQNSDEGNESDGASFVITNDAQNKFLIVSGYIAPDEVVNGARFTEGTVFCPYGNL